MNIFNFKSTKRQIEIFEGNVAEILKINFPNIKETLALSPKIYSIQFSTKPSAIHLLRGYNEEILPELETNFDLYGVKVFNKKRNQFEDITLFFHNDLLALIEVENPKKFHKIYDYNQLQIGELRTKEINIENLDKKNTLDILKNISQDQLNQLEIDDAIEIECNKNVYYTILDMEEGNYIAIDKSGKVYRLNHDHIEKVKGISNDIDSFFAIYKGRKSNLSEIMYN
ncbi:MAG: hypothetical protein GZ087_01165 [Flavobacterium sp.]|nr:hypothetical protein [Flavobacterium sp.]